MATLFHTLTLTNTFIALVIYFLFVSSLALSAKVIFSVSVSIFHSFGLPLSTSLGILFSAYLFLLSLPCCRQTDKKIDTNTHGRIKLIMLYKVVSLSAHLGEAKSIILGYLWNWDFFEMITSPEVTPSEKITVRRFTIRRYVSQIYAVHKLNVIKEEREILIK